MTGRVAVFVDRDGTVIEELGYLSDPDRVRLLPGAAAAIRRLREAGAAIVMVTNQSGIARGLYTEADYRAVQREVARCLAAEGAVLDGVYHCPHHPDFTGPCACRKPGTALFRRAAAELGLALEGAWFIGDRVRDVLPALELGGKGILVRTGYGGEEASRAPGDVVVVADLAAAARVVLGEREGAGQG